MRDFKRLRAFELADEIAIMTYQLTQRFPKEEAFGLTSQMRRAAFSIPSNIVEGCSRNTESDFLRFLDIAFGSLRELRYQFSLASRLGYLATENVATGDSKLDETEKVLASLIRTIRSQKQNRQSPEPLNG